MAGHRGGGEGRHLRPRLRRDDVRRPDRPLHGDHVRGDVVGRRGHLPRHLRLDASRSRDHERGHARAGDGVDPAVLRDPGRPQARRRSASPSPTRARTSRASRRAPPTTRRRTTWTLNGAKTWITNGGLANLHVIVASVDPALGSRGQASFVVPEGTPGISQGRKFQKMGIRASHTAEVLLQDCKVPGANLLGGKEKLDAKLARVHARASRPRARPRWPPSRRRAAHRRPGDRHRARVVRVLPRVRQAARASSGARSSRTRRSPSSSPT